MSKSKRKISGFTLIEVTMAISAMAIFISTILGIQNLGIKGALIGAQRYQASWIAEGVIDQMKANYYSNWQNGVENTISNLVGNANQQVVIDDQKFNVSIGDSLPGSLETYLRSAIFANQSAENVNDFSHDLMTMLERKVEVNINWYGHGKRQDITLTTILSDWRPKF